MRRRQFISLLGGAAAWPLAARAQQAERVRRIGFLTQHSPELAQPNLESLRDGLRQLGLIEGRNLLIEYRYAVGRDALRALAEELVRLNMDLMVVHGAEPVWAIQDAGGTMPVVFAVVADPVGVGLVATLARPSGNSTGLSDLHTDLVPKRVQLLKEAIPSLSRVAVLWDPTVISLQMQWKDMQAAAPRLAVHPVSLEVRSAADLQDAFGAMRSEHPDALIIFGTPSLAILSKQIIDFAIAHRIPAMYTHAAWVQAGGLMSYGANHPALYRRAASYVERILKGAKPAEIPVEQPTKFELVFNLRTAKAIGLEIPPTLLARADEVIE